MASLVRCEGSAALQALFKRGRAAGQGASSQWPVASMSPHTHMCTHEPTLTQKQVEDPGGHPARAER